MTMCLFRAENVTGARKYKPKQGILVLFDDMNVLAALVACM